MSKKIKIKINDAEKLIFSIIDENPKPGDTFSLLEINEIDFSILHNAIQLKKENFFNELLKKEIEIEKIKFQQKFENSEKYINMIQKTSKDEKEIFRLNNELENNKKIEIKILEIEKNKIRETFSKEVNILKTELEKNKIQVSNIIKIETSKISEELKNKINEEEVKNINLNNLIEKNKNEYLKVIDTLKVELKTNENKTSDLIKIETSKISENLKNKINEEEIKNINLNNLIEKNKSDFSNKEKELNLKWNEKINSEKINSENQKALHLKELKILKNDVEKEYEEKLNKEFEEKSKIISELDILRNSRTRLNIKIMGEELENEISSMYSNQLSMLENQQFGKTTEIGDKPDFFFKILNDDNSIISTIIIEAKTENPNSKNKKKNKDHYEKLFKDTKKYNGQYSILVSELELEDKFYIKRVSEYENMYVVRPEYLTNFLHILYKLEISKKDFNLDAINFKDSQEILNEFELMKTEILNNSILSIRKKLKSIEKDADSILSKAKKIRDNAENALGVRNLETIEAKLNNFKIAKIISKIDKLK